MHCITFYQAAISMQEPIVFQHLYNIYQKLNVKIRRQAVKKARTLGIV